ncbi:MAG: hypothetical protein ACYSO7_07355, partial [Planctomycetota bacterium]
SAGSWRNAVRKMTPLSRGFSFASAYQSLENGFGKVSMDVFLSLNIIDRTEVTVQILQHPLIL